MTQPLTDVQATRQNETVETQWQGATATPVNPNAGTVPDVYARMNLANQAKEGSPFTPPSTGEIHQQMWVGSFMMALMSGLATGNAGAAIVGGMWAAIGIHDYGNTLQQRAKSVSQLQKDGFSERAILKWYQDGDNSELDKEQELAERKAEHAETAQYHKDELHEREADRAQRSQDHRDSMGQQYALAKLHEEGADRRAALTAAATADNAARADARLQKQEQGQFDTELRKTIEGPKQKQYYMRMAEEAMGQLEHYRETGNKAGMAEAYHNVRNNLARASLGGGATLTDEGIESATGLPSWADKKANEMGILVNGKPSDEWVATTKSQISDDIKNEQTIMQKVGKDAYDSLTAAGKSPELANVMTNRGMIGTGIKPRDWSKPAPEPEQQDQKTPPPAPVVDDVMAKYGHVKK